jgi:hypothetical protein
MEGRDRRGVLRRRPGRLDWRATLPDAGADPGEQVPKLGARCPLVPTAAAAAHASRPLVDDFALALASRTEAQMEGPGAIAQVHNVDRTVRWPRHQSLAIYSDGDPSTGQIRAMIARARIGRSSSAGTGRRRERPRGR